VTLALCAHNGLGWLLAQSGRPAEAEVELRAGLELFRQPTEDRPVARHLRESATIIDNNLSVVLRRLLALLHEASFVGYRSFDAYRTEDALDPIHGRNDFRMLMMDLAMPAKPFDAAL
jgi:hypothetical protein